MRTMRCWLPATSAEPDIPAPSHDATLAEHYLALALDDAADAVEFFSGALQQRLRLLEFLGGNHDQHTEAHIEGAKHLLLRHVAEFLQMFEDGQHRPGAEFDHG